jgi:hypothetical protein
MAGFGSPTATPQQHNMLRNGGGRPASVMIVPLLFMHTTVVGAHFEELPLRWQSQELLWWL